MNVLRRTVSALLVGGLLMTCVACSSTSNAGSQTAASTVPASSTAEAASSGTVPASSASSGDFRIAYIAKNTVDAFHQRLNNAAEAAMKDLVSKGRIKSYKIYDGQTDPVTQSNLCTDALNDGANLVILLPAEAAGSAAVLTQCKAKNVPCVVVNSQTNNTDQLAAAYVGSDDVQAGKMLAQFVQQQIPNGGGYGHIMGIIGNSAQIQRGKGLHSVLDTDSKWKLLSGCEQGADWQAEKAVKFSEDWLQKYGKQLNAIICDNDDMSSAVQTAMNAKGRNDIVCVGVDGNKGALTMVKNGALKATIYQDAPSQGTKAIELADKILHGETVSKTTWVDYILVTKDNVDKYLAIVK